MPLKYIGGGLLLCLAVVYCMAKATVWQTVKLRLSAYVALLSYTKTSIACFGTPLADILSKAPPELIGQLGGAGDGACSDFATLCRRGADLPGESGRLLTSLADEIGTIWRKEQLERLSYYIGALEKEKAAFCSSLPSRLRLHGTLSVCGALAVILLIW